MSRHSTDDDGIHIARVIVGAIVLVALIGVYILGSGVFKLATGAPMGGFHRVITIGAVGATALVVVVYTTGWLVESGYNTIEGWL